ncbi:MAG TPA: hypothetical protein VLE44_01620 [Candidatus Saccharimonadales bacterium]|nr:hypothetical protein [Candidatus Saccharimonadales bacterium]
MEYLVFVHRSIIIFLRKNFRKMAQSGDAFRKQHDTDELKDPKLGDPITPEDQADNDNESVDIEDIDKLHKEAFGDEDNKSIGDEINKDEEARVKDIVYEEPES